MAHSTSSPAAQQTPKTQFDWYTFLRKAFINGLKTYGAALMVAAPEPALNLPKSPSQVRTCNQEIFEKDAACPIRRVSSCDASETRKFRYACSGMEHRE